MPGEKRNSHWYKIISLVLLIVGRIWLKIFSEGDNKMPVNFSLNTRQKGRHADVLRIANERTKKIVIEFTPPDPGNYYVAAYDRGSGAISLN